MSQPYTDHIKTVLPRLLALFDVDKSSSTYGIGDRYYWAWGLIDFGNGTFQGAVHGLSRLLVHELLPYGFSEKIILKRIDSMFHGAECLIRKNGSMEEAFPYEGSFCVTALVSYDLLSAIELLDNRLDHVKKEKYLSIVRPMIDYLRYSDETHAIISNHLATAAAALFKWDMLSHDNNDRRGKDILKRIIENQSEEGWFREYDGADPGYQSLCTYYLADLHRIRPDLNLLEPLKKSIQFLWYFAHPDGSFGGIYGSRNTRFYYPSGIEYLANEIPEASALANFMRKSIENECVVGLSSMDEPNLIPMFNSYCWAAVCASNYPGAPEVPSQTNTSFRKYWEKAGIFVDSGIDYYTIISTSKGGVVYHFSSQNKKYINTGVIAKDKSNRLYSTQAFQSANEIIIEDESIEIRAGFQPVTKQLMAPTQLLILRLLNITLMRITKVREKIKQILVKMLITNKRKPNKFNTRKITLGKELRIIDEINNSNNMVIIDDCKYFVAIHMASQGYWQIQDEMEV